MNKQSDVSPRALSRVRLKNILSFGPQGLDIGLGPLNVLIGPNGAGKSNLIEVLGLLKAVPGDITEPIRKGGGIGEWIWKGKHDAASGRVDEAAIEVVTVPLNHGPALEYHLRLAEEKQKIDIVSEELEDASESEERRTYFLISSTEKKVYVQNSGESERRLVQLGPNFKPKESLLAQRKDPDQYPELTFVAELFAGFRLFRNWLLGPNAELRRPQRTDFPSDFLLEDGSNLALILSGLRHRGLDEKINRAVSSFYNRARSVDTTVQGATIQVYLKEGLSSPTPPTRLSDGTLRFLCLLTILLHPEPPPVVCIEEPELGFHPDIMPVLGELLVEASERTQLIVTTHSPELIDALSDTPESVVVCERTEQGTEMRRLDPKQLEKWLEQYRLGELWQKGEIGGTRW